MGHPGTQMLSWALCVFLCLKDVSAVPHYMVAMPAVLQAGGENKFCACLFEPDESLVMTVTLSSLWGNITLLERTSSKEFQECTQFQVPSMEIENMGRFEVKVQGSKFFSRESRGVMLRDNRPKSFVQTDKPIYLPGQTVHFRVVSLDAKFRPAKTQYDMIELEDPYRNRIGQWLNKTSHGKILQLSYSLNSEARQGVYTISVTEGYRKEFHNFKVEKYVLPKFDVNVNVREEVSVGLEGFDAKICAKYTYGQPVPGSVKVEVCRPLQRNYYESHEITELGVTTPCDTKTKQTDKTGCATFNFKMSNFTKLDTKIAMDTLEVSAIVKEEGTGISNWKEEKIRISYVLGKLSFVDTPKLYEPGSFVEGKVKAVDYDDQPIPDMPLHLFVGERWSAELLQNLTTDSSGFASFTFNTSRYNWDIELSVANTPNLDYRDYRTAFYERGTHTVYLSKPPSLDTKTVSSVNVEKKDEPLVCDKEEELSIQYTIVKEAKGSVDLMYLILSRGALVMQGQKKVEVQDKSVNQGEVSFKLLVSPDMAPVVQVVAYIVLPSKNVIAHSANFQTEKCFRNKVSLEFSPTSAVPGEEAKMQLSAQPDSLCGVSAIDQSVLIKEPGKTLNVDRIFDLLPVRELSHTPYEVEDPEPCLQVRPKRSVMPYPDRDSKDAHSVFSNVGLKMATNLMTKSPTCLTLKGVEYYRGIHRGYGIQVSSMSIPQRMGMGGASLSPSNDEPLATVRTFFPETWIWDLVEVGESGTKDVAVTVPDTITTWETETFCLSSQGFGLAPRVNLTVFQPFFVELTLPYSIIRGEVFELKATVFNYLKSCIMVKVTAAPSPDYTLTPLSGNQYTSCLCGSERRTLSWTMTPTALGTVNVSVTAEAVPSHASCDNEVVSVPERGRIDVVTRPLIVKAEGTEVTTTHNWLLCPKGNALTEETEMQLPDNVIPGSTRATVSVLGDILGRALKNLDGLLRMPYGCGEQNMALLAPNIYILHYLQKTEQLTEAIKEKAFSFLTNGYQRQLNYKDESGAYSTFGSGPGNTWLTAFVMRSFYKAQSFVFIDSTKIEESRTWLENKQRENGCFEQSGKLFNNRMKGGVSDEVTLSAYITAAFLEMNMKTNTTVLKRSLSCLKESISGISNTYTTALLAYVFTLAGDMETRAQLLQQLDTVAIKEGGVLYWSQTASETSASLSVEISSYVLMAKLSAPHTAEDLGYASSIVRWLTQQQNHYGGFSSTQDTVVALQALSLYSGLVFTRQGSSAVTFQSPGGQLEFDINPENKLLYQEKILQQASGKFSLEVKGSACASVQISHHYNIPTVTDGTNLKVQVETETDSSGPRPKVTLKLLTEYSGKENSTNMMILDIALLSGYIPDPQPLKDLKGSWMVDRVEHKDGHVMIYIEKFPKDFPVLHHVVLIQQLPVQNLKPAVVTLYDYYHPSDRAETEYTVSA
ncbi:alpha-2-macroglobulin-like [Menidia menidia]